MSAQMVEILILAIIAFLIISKLLSILGTTDEDDPARRTGFFGEPKGLKDVTGTVETVQKGSKGNVIPLRPGVVYSTNAKINDIICQIVEKMPDFNPEKFLKGSKSACKMIIAALKEKDEQTLTALVDKRFIDEISRKDYGVSALEGNIEAKFEDAYSFGNSIYLKVLITANNFKEFWVFTRNIQQTGPDWHLSNIEA